MHVAIDSDVSRVTHHRGHDEVEEHHHKHRGKRLEETHPESPAAVVEIGETEDNEGPSESSGHGNAVSRAVAAARAAAREAGEKVGPAVSHAARLANGSLHEVEEPEGDESEEAEVPAPAPVPSPEETADPNETGAVPVPAPSEEPAAKLPTEPVTEPVAPPVTEAPVEPVGEPVDAAPAPDVTSSSTSIHLSIFSLNVTFASFSFGGELNIQA